MYRTCHLCLIYDLDDLHCGFALLWLYSIVTPGSSQHIASARNTIRYEAGPFAGCVIYLVCITSESTRCPSQAVSSLVYLPTCLPWDSWAYWDVHVCLELVPMPHRHHEKVSIVKQLDDPFLAMQRRYLVCCSYPGKAQYFWRQLPCSILMAWYTPPEGTLLEVGSTYCSSQEEHMHESVESAFYYFYFLPHSFSPTSGMSSSFDMRYVHRGRLVKHPLSAATCDTTMELLDCRVFSGAHEKI